MPWEGKAPRACIGNGVGSAAGDAGEGAVVGGGAVVADERPDVGRNRAENNSNLYCSTRNTVKVRGSHKRGGKSY